MLIIYVDGIGTAKIPDADDDGRSILRPVAQRVADTLLTRDGITSEIVRAKWSASMAGLGSKSWPDASREAVASIRKAMDSHPGKDVVLLAYSGGNRPVHDFIDTADTRTLLRVRAVGLMSDPYRPSNAWQHDTPKPWGYGICGARRTRIDDRVLWSTVLGDVISDAPHDSPLRTLADVSDVMPGQFLWDLGGHLHRGDLQLAWKIGVILRDPLGWFVRLGPRLDEARRDVEGYLTGKHTTSYHRQFKTTRPDGTLDLRSPAERLADSVAWKARPA